MIELEVLKIAKEIKDIKIQGASNIEIASIECIKNYISITKLIGEEFIIELTENINHLIAQRPNEPKLRNSLNFILITANNHKFEENKNKLIEEIKLYEEKTKEGNRKVCEIASNIIVNGGKYLTHCHSTMVEYMFKMAHDRGLDFEVYCTETRPRYQGRITAKNLADYGIKTISIVDSSVTHYLKEIDYFFTGADVVFPDGSIMNKVGTNLISSVCPRYSTPHIVLTTTHCCEINSLLMLTEKVEERDGDEVWTREDGKPENLIIKNPAFDIVPHELIDKFITEEGVFSSESLYLWVNRHNLGNK